MFETGGRYRNRIGWYEVLEIEGQQITIRYEHDGTKHIFDEMETLWRIYHNIQIEEEKVTPYDDVEVNTRYFQTLGYLAGSAFIEAIIPPKSKSGFETTFRNLKGRFPQQNEKGYYVHHDPNVDKWGTEMRLTFRSPDSISLDDLDFGQSVSIVDSPNTGELRINNNGLCWRLLSLGFELGATHSIKEIESNVPDRYRYDFRNGISIA